MIVVDTNVLSETSRKRPHSIVVEWLARHRSQLWVPAVVLAELCYGVEKLPRSRQRADLESWLADLRLSFEDHLLPFEEKAAEAHGRLRGRLKRLGKPMNAPDSYVAATALSLGIPVATRNISDFQHAQVKLIDPWSD
ncbi:MAG TPA: type II toxin-antitoxin system VapC family toxin [Allosphingosinicella sp.]|nr:type II toxin-antitoxin system VapC family toxin [Allosphingosinicella sp.]